MRRKLVAGNWKMNLTCEQGKKLVSELASEIAGGDVDIVVCPGFLSIPGVSDALQRTPIGLGAQDVFWADSGAYTGRVSASMLKEYGVEYCIVGHSETRGRFGKLEIPETTLAHFGETDETVNLKLRALSRVGIAPILCVGETLAEREAGQTDTVNRRQLEGALAGVRPAGLVVAYEPVWAIGTGMVCESGEASRVCGAIRRELIRLLGDEVGGATRILYGGSVKSSNAGELFSQPDVDGGLVGGASLDPAEFARIVAKA